MERPEGLKLGLVQELPEKITSRYFPGCGRMARMGVHGDGSCFFHSVCAILNYKNYNFLTGPKQKEVAYEFRCDFSKKFTPEEYEGLTHKKFTDSEFSKKNESFCVVTTWADEVMIKFASKVLDMNIIFVNFDTNTAFCGVHDSETMNAAAFHESGPIKPTGIIAWVKRSHFEPIFRIDEIRKDTVTFTTLFDAEHDKTLIQTLMSEYAIGCKI